MLENIEVSFKIGQSRETGKTGPRYTQTKHRTLYVGHQYSQTSTNNVNKT